MSEQQADESVAVTSKGASVRGLRVETPQGTPIVEALDLDIAPGRILGLVGESGSGKTTVGLAMLGHARRGMQISGGGVWLDGTNLFGLSHREL
ncbi:MAG: ATP-binding cassette domain-containing protein, partial [Actinobacteria bacterium]|nr:ATP-binding cassette domain-containing protein [Actinomycetota bacterium]